MSNLFIIHSYNADTKESFGPYLMEKGKQLGLNVIFPDFPTRKEAEYKKWCKIMDEYILNGQLNSDSIIVAHSLGTHFIPKYLADRNLQIKCFISCAGFLNDIVGRDDLNKIFDDFRPNEKQIQKSIELMKNRYAIYSNNDHMNPIEELEYYAEKFHAKKVFIENIGHLGKTSGITELPEIVEIIHSNLKDKKNF